MMDGTTRTRKVSLTQDEPIGGGVRASLQTFLGTLTAPQKVELAVKGNREVRQILSRDPSALVARAVVKSPRLTDADVAAYAASPQTNEEVLRAIGEDRGWMGKPRLLSFVVSNPRTPPPVALRLVVRLPQNELALLVRNVNASIPVRNEAKRLLVKRRV
jgi:hypothetical protein